MLKRSDGRWQEQIKLPGMDKPKYFYGKTQKEVTKKIAEWKKGQAEGKSFQFAADRWADDKCREVSYNTEKTYLTYLERMKEHFEGRSIGSIKADEVNAYIRQLAGKGYAKQTISLHHTLLTMVFDYAIVSGWCETNPCKAVKLPRDLPKTKRENLTADQLKKVKDGVKLEFGLFPFMLLHTGMRRGELLALRWEDIDRKGRSITVSKTVVFAGNNPRITTPKTEAGRRSVVLLDALLEVLPEGGSGYVFGGDKPLTGSEFRRAWANWAGAAGLAERVQKSCRNQKTGKDRNYYEWEPEITPHQLRHEFASILYDAGVEAKDAQDLLGHADVNTTLNIYTHIRQSRREVTADRLNRFLSGGDGEEEECQNVVKFPTAL